MPVEAMAYGKPVIAYAKGGALETVSETGGSETGILFQEQTQESLADAVSRFLQRKFDPATIRKQVEAFDKEDFKSKMEFYVRNRLEHCVVPSN